jgi:hypothetical protein
MGCRGSNGKEAGKKIVIVRAESMNKQVGQEINDGDKNTELKHYFKFYEKRRFISNEELLVMMAPFSSKTV